MNDTAPGADGSRRPLFSVLVAAYNQAEWVEDTLDTVAAQTVADWELVVVDDGSTDDTGERVQGWMDGLRATRPGVRTVLAPMPNGGQSAAMEHGFGLCTGRWIALLDSDDRWLPEKLERIAAAIAADPAAGMVVHPMYVIDDRNRRTGDVRPQRAALSEGDLREQIRQTTRHVAPATSAVAIRADVFAQLVPMPTKGFRTAADAYLTMGASLLAPVRAVHEPLAEYRMHPDGNHIRTMLSAEGVKRWVELQTVIAEHFGLGAAADRNSFFLRHVFALQKFQGGPGQQVGTYARLARATWSDGAFGAREKLIFSAFWTACLLAPRPVFRRLWRTFQMKQTGFDKIGLRSTTDSSI
ncbi:MAG TPA: glycosyltransferase [Longimicrobium sp.]|jgi:glycosyltransferase involved in cell wall biosynthesis|uniref:glycosyltransferase family 2 protein n=1 Tax=Longimicrobium sp. TaxID=2029185 RepID=UPI002EDA8A08